VRTVLSELRGILSKHYRHRALELQAGAFVQAILDAAAFGLLYPLLQLFTKASGAAPSRVVKISESLLFTSNFDVLKLRLGIASVAFFVLSSVCGIILTRAQCKVAANSEADVASRLFAAYLKAPYLQQTRRNSAELNRNVYSACADIHVNVLLAAFVVAGNLLTVVILVAVIAVANLFVTAMSVVYFGIVAVIYLRIISPRARAAGRQNLLLSGRTIRASQEGFYGLKTFQASNAIEPVIASYASGRNELARYRQKITFYQMFPQYYVQAAMIGGVVLFSVVVIASGTKDVTALIGLMVAASIRIMPVLYQILSSLNKIRSGQASLHEVYSDLRRLTEKDLYEGSPSTYGTVTVRPDLEQTAWQLSGSIVLSEVAFSYPESDSRALAGVSLEIVRGTSVGLVGPSGAGKSTIVDLLLGLFATTDGTIEIDGVPLSGPMVRRWRAAVGYVPQEIFLIDGTVSQNVAFYQPDSIDADGAIWDALDRAHLADFVSGLPEGIGTVVGERGVRFSGGQRQRLGIARALYRKPSVLILDEATSALDTATEAAFAGTIEQLKGSMTLITVAHRLSTVRYCDTIFLLQDGEVVARGPFEELRSKSELFDELARLAQIDS
jgi:ATP-binding cassette, subfamily B, bacterial PglK